MTANAILQAACSQFAEKGFEGASLAGIAQAVGIKKQSIATYFPKKEDLFMAAFGENGPGITMNFLNNCIRASGIHL